MKNKIVLIFIALTCSTLIFADVTPASSAPDFSLVDLQGKAHKLSEFKGKWVVLEWFNKDCPFVRKHYGAGNMQRLQDKYTRKGVVWLTIKSSAPGEQGNESAGDSQKTYNSLKAKASYVLIDEKGIVGRLYGAKTTPHMFIINPEQVVSYAGAIDDNDSPDKAVIPSSKNYIEAALDAGMAGKKILVASTKPYGCGVKY